MNCVALANEHGQILPLRALCCRKASRGNALQGGGFGVPNIPASGSPHTEDRRHPIPRRKPWRVLFGRGETEPSRPAAVV
jgi:hypothetical protein